MKVLNHFFFFFNFFYPDYVVNKPISVLFIVLADKPLAPGRPEVNLLGRGTASLTWSPPREDGGSPITNYIVEMKSSQTYSWAVANIAMRVSEPAFTVTDLMPGTSYEFRVTAENKLGRSDPSPPSRPVQIRDITPSELHLI